jgi:hypothetical protein
MRMVRLVLAGLIALPVCAVGCATTPEEQMRELREQAVSPGTFARVLPYLEGLAPGDSLALFEGARRIHVLGSRRDEAGPRPVVVMPSWIASLSGGAAGGISMLGQLVGRSEEVLYGSHVFGFVESSRIVPRYQVLTRASLVGREEFEVLSAEGVRGLGLLPRREGPLYFRDLHVVGARALAFPEASAAAVPEGTLSELSAEAAYRRILPILEGLPPGTDLLSMLAALGAVFVSEDFGESHGLRVPGFLQHERVHTRTVERPEAITKLRPFGWIDGERVVVERMAIFENDRLQRVEASGGAGSSRDGPGSESSSLARGTGGRVDPVRIQASCAGPRPASLLRNSSREFTCGKGSSGTARSRNAHRGSQPSPTS